MFFGVVLKLKNLSLNTKRLIFPTILERCFFMNEKLDSFLIKNKKINTFKSIDYVQASIKHQINYLGKGVIIAILDTGIASSHDLFKKKIISGRNFLDEEPSEIYEDLNGHGTHIAGIVTMMAPKAQLLILKVLNTNGIGKIKYLKNSIRYALDWKGKKEETIDIISISIGGNKCDDELHDLIKEAYSKNIPIVVSAGNNGDENILTNEISYPAYFPEVISVGSLNSDKISSFSNSNAEVDVYAPGTNIKSSFLNNSYAVFSGTSMATPHISGALALLIDEYKKYFPYKIPNSILYKILLKNSKETIIQGQKVYSLMLNNNSINIDSIKESQND